MASEEGLRSRVVDKRKSYIRVYDDADSDLPSEADSGEDYGLKALLLKHWFNFRRAHAERVKTYSALDWLSLCLPCVSWLRTYKVKENLWIDAITGLSIGFMVVPQGMSYALLAGLPAVYGLYGALSQVFIYAALGSSRHLAVGPVAVTSLLMGHALRDIYPEAKKIQDPSDPGEYGITQDLVNQAAIQVSFLVAVLWTAAGTFRLSFLANFLSHSVISGFTTGAACIIGLSQLKYFFGVTIPQSETALKIIIELAKVIEDSQWREMVMFAAWFTLLMAIKTTSKRFKRLRWMRPLGPITILALGILTVVIGDLDGRGWIKTVKDVPKGLPPLTVGDWFPFANISKQLRAALVLFLVDFMESISIAKALARKHKYEIHATQELVAIGVANFAGSAFSASTATGSFSRSSVAADIGAKTPLHGFVTGGVVMMVLLFVTSVLERTPYNATGAIILSSVLGLIEWSEAIFLFRNNKLDFLVWAAAALITFFAGVELGLGVAIGLAVLIVVLQSAFPHTAVLGRLPDTDVFRNVKQYPRAVEHPHIVVMRIDAPIYFANVETFRSRMAKYIERANSRPELAPVRFVVIDLSPVSFIDSTGMHALHELAKAMRTDGLRLVLSNPSSKVQAQLRRGAVLDEVGPEWVFVRSADAIAVCLKAPPPTLSAAGVASPVKEGTEQSTPQPVPVIEV